MKKWEYTVSTNTIWTSFDFGEVEAETYDEAEQKAIAELEENFAKANEALKPLGFDVHFDKTQVELKEIK